MTTRRVAVAASGGRDSTALLHCTVSQAAALGLEVVALHVHHGLMAGADAWLHQVQTQARRWGAGFATRRLQTRPGPGDSVEAWARRERYQALTEMALEAQCPLVLLAHHRRDQAETWLLQALRGAGARGLSAMPAQAERTGLTWCRPWLHQPRTAIDAYVRRHQLRSIEDDSNSDLRYARNRLRQQVWPALTAAFADAETALVAAATHAQAAHALAAEVAAADLQPLLVAQGGEKPGLRVGAWQALTAARRVNALRFWLHQVLGQGAPETLVQRLLHELTTLEPATASARNGLRWPAPQAELRVHQGVLIHAVVAPHVTVQPPMALDLSRPGLWPVPGWSGSFQVQRVAAQGAPAALLRQAQLRPRAGGERFAAQPLAPPRSLKKQYQSAAVPAWQRQGPLVWTEDQRLVFVPALGIDGRCRATPGQPQCSLRWLPDQA